MAAKFKKADLLFSEKFVRKQEKWTKELWLITPAKLMSLTEGCETKDSANGDKSGLFLNAFPSKTYENSADVKLQKNDGK